MSVLLRLAFVAAALAPIAPRGARAQQCELRGRANVSELNVTPPATPAFVLDATDMQMRVAPGDGRRPVVVRVEAPIAFEARTAPAHVPYVLGRSLAAASGVLSLTPASPIAAVRARGATLDVDLALEDGVSARVQAPCNAVGVGATASPPTTPPAAQPGRSWAPVRPKLRVYAQAGGRHAIEITLAQPDTFVMHEESVDRGFVRVRRPFAHGELRGWVRRADLRDAANTPANLTGSGHPTGGLGLCGTGAGGGDSYLGSATIAAGTEISFARARGIWARVPADVDLIVSHAHGDDWVQIMTVQGLRDRERCQDELDHAWVERRHVRFPRAAGTR